jgi:hypothetical protein
MKWKTWATMLLILAGAGVASAGTSEAILSVSVSTTDNYYNLYVADGGPTKTLVAEGFPGNWQTANVVTGLSLPVKVITVDAWNDDVSMPPGSNNPAAFLATFTTDQGVIRTGDAGWKVFVVNTANPVPTDWQLSTYNTSSNTNWVPATSIAKYGTDIWGNGVSGFSDYDAYWIWSTNNGRTNVGNAVDQHVLLRLDISGVGSTPVPEPLTMVSAFLAIAGLGGYIRRRTGRAVA